MLDFMCCTESLGFESSDERIRAFDDRIITNRIDCRLDEEEKEKFKRSRKLLLAAKKRDQNQDHHNNNKLKKLFPPPLSSMTQDGRPTFFLRPIRRDGRLMLTEVKILRPEILRASRQDGRLKLHLVQEDDGGGDADDDDREEEEEEIEIMQDNNDPEQREAEEEEQGSQFSGGGGGGACEGVRRCHEQVGQYNDQHVWRQHELCLTIR